MVSGYITRQARSTRTLSNSVTYQRRPKVSFEPVISSPMQ